MAELANCSAVSGHSQLLNKNTRLSDVAVASFSADRKSSFGIHLRRVGPSRYFFSSGLSLIIERHALRAGMVASTAAALAASTVS